MHASALSGNVSGTIKEDYCPPVISGLSCFSRLPDFSPFCIRIYHVCRMLHSSSTSDRGLEAILQSILRLVKHPPLPQPMLLATWIAQLSTILDGCLQSSHQRVQIVAQRRTCTPCIVCLTVTMAFMQQRWQVIKFYS